MIVRLKDDGAIPLLEMRIESGRGSWVTRFLRTLSDLGTEKALARLREYAAEENFRGRIARQILARRGK